MKKVINQHLENVSDKQLVVALINRGLITEEEMAFRLISDEELLNKSLHGSMEIVGGYVHININIAIVKELERRTYIHDGKMEIYLSDGNLNF